MKYGLSFEDSEHNFNYDSLITYNGKIAFWHYFWQLNNEFPQSKANSTYIDNQMFFDKIVKRYKVKAENLWKDEYYDSTTESYIINNFLIQIDKDLMVVKDVNEGGISVLFGDQSDKKKIDKIHEVLMSCEIITPPMEAGSQIFLLYASDGYLSLQEFDVRKSEMDIETHYNDNFIAVNEKIIKRLNTEDDKGLVLLHGEPGTGKTHYIRYLTGKINKKMIYIPSDYADKVASPQFLPLMISNPNSILIIEDAESIIEAREATGRSAAVSSLLNIADGLLSDCLNLQILCTFNTHIDNIDKALLRKGRLIANYEFKALATEKAQKLSDSLGLKAKFDKPATLSDIYNQETEED